MQDGSVSCAKNVFAKYAQNACNELWDNFTGMLPIAENRSSADGLTTLYLKPAIFSGTSFLKWIANLILNIDDGDFWATWLDYVSPLWKNAFFDLCN